jgi:hypothetical protein
MTGTKPIIARHSLISVKRAIRQHQHLRLDFRISALRSLSAMPIEQASYDALSALMFMARNDSDLWIREQAVTALSCFFVIPQRGIADDVLQGVDVLEAVKDALTDRAPNTMLVRAAAARSLSHTPIRYIDGTITYIQAAIAGETHSPVIGLCQATIIELRAKLNDKSQHLLYLTHRLETKHDQRA